MNQPSSKQSTPKTFKNQYLRTQFMKYDQAHLADRLLDQIQLNDTQKFKIFKLQNRITQIMKQNQYLAKMLQQQKNTQKQKLKIQQEQLIKLFQREFKNLTYLQGIEKQIKYKQILSELLIIQNDNTKLIQQQMQPVIHMNKTANQQLIHKQKTLASLELVIAQLQNQNIHIQTTSKKLLQQYKQAIQIIDKQFIKIKELERELDSKYEQLEQKNQNINLLEVHLNNSVIQIQKLNMAAKQLSRQDQRGAYLYEKLQKKYGEMKKQNENALLALSETNKILQRSQNEKKKVMDLNNLLRGFNKQLQLKLQRYQSIIKQKQELQYNLNKKPNPVYQTQKNHQLFIHKNIDQLKQQLKRLQIQIQQNFNFYQRQLQGNNKIIRQLQIYKKQAQTHSNFLQKHKNIPEYKSNHKHKSEDDWPKIITQSKTLEQSTNNLRKIVQRIAKKINDLTQVGIQTRKIGEL